MKLVRKELHGDRPPEELLRVSVAELPELPANEVVGSEMEAAK